jgi:O-6-methylguanine DNA methyltransferase
VVVLSDAALLAAYPWRGSTLLAACLRWLPTPPTVPSTLWCQLLQAWCLTADAAPMLTLPIPLQVPGQTPFRLGVWQALPTIPWGCSVTYGQLATQLGLPVGSARAVGQALKANPYPLYWPCHRVVGAHKGAGGYFGQAASAEENPYSRLKLALLAHEA